ncbi:hypothetical protein CEXT_253331 [Caerostris extrusa]|uniref:Uncharacterized protein n=1 Tax=Caerostris extrusa TaxID=172846 RepID=A0AAV4MSE4_CAEEX|nr:hypothetical protein CEXT_253331 [Caerostris extrusa]
MFQYKNQYRQVIPVQEEDSERISLKKLAINDGSGLDIDRIWLTDEAIFFWMVSLTDIICDLAYICLKYDYCISQNLPFWMQSLAKASFGPFT